MAVDVTFNTITSGYNLSKLNENFTRIDTALQDALSRSGTSPNSMSADIDLNGNDLLNVGTLSLSGGSTLSQIVGYAEEWATKAEDSLISVAAGGDGSTDYSSLHHAAKAEDSATAAAASETAASASETAAASSETNAATSETNAVAAASAVAYKYTFSTTTTMADPGAGVLRFNNGTVSSVTAIALDATTADTGNPDISDYIALWDDVTNSVAKGYLTIRKNGSPGTFAIFKVTGSVIDNTGWLQVAVTHVQSAGTFSNSDNLYIAFTQSGEDGSGSMSSFTAGNGLTDGGDNSVTNGETLSVQATSNKGAAVTASGIEVSPNNATDTAIALTDEVLFADADDSNNVKKDTVQGIIDLVPSTSTNKNLIINGDMRVGQRGDQTGITTGQYGGVDRFRIDVSSCGTWSMTQDNTSVPEGFGYALKLACTTADASPAVSDYVSVSTRLEGQDLQHLKFGTANAVSLTLSFWVRSSKTGAHTVNLYNVDNSRCWPQSYSISVANTWEQKTITWTGDTSSGFSNDNGFSLQVEWFLDSGTNFDSGTPSGAWEALSNTIRNYQNPGLADANTNTWHITGVKLEVGSTATDFVSRPYAEELALCERYYQTSGTGGQGNYIGIQGHITSGITYGPWMQFTTVMRTAPTITLTNNSALNFGTSVGTAQTNTRGFQEQRSSSGTGGGYFFSSWTADAEL